MDREEFFAYVLDRYGVGPEFPWLDDPVSAVFRHAGSRKWFALAMRIPASRLGLSGDGLVDILNLKCDPVLIGSVRQLPGVLPAYHMNKEHWITVLLDGSVDADTVRELLALSHSLTDTRKKPSRKGKCS